MQENQRELEEARNANAREIKEWEKSVDEEQRETQGA